MSTPTSESGTNQPTGSEPQRIGDSNDTQINLLGRIESFLRKAEQELASWLHHPAAAAANQHIQDAKAHIAASVPAAQAADAATALTGITPAAPEGGEQAEQQESDAGAAAKEATAQ